MFHYALAVLSGTLYFLGFAGFGIWPLAFVALLPILWALDPEHTNAPLSTRKLIGVGALFGLVTNLGGYYWLVGMLKTFSGFPIALCIVFASILCAYQGGVLVVFALAFRKLREAGMGNVLASVIAMCAGEWAFPLLFQHYFGNSLHALPYAIQTADLGGPLLVTALLVAANAGLYELSLSFRRRSVRLRPVLSVAALWALALGYGVYRVNEVDARAAAAEKLHVATVQTNMGIFAKREDPEEGLRRHIEQSRELERREKLDLLVWPESAFGWFLPESTKNVSEYIGVGTTLHTPTLFGGLARRSIDGKKRPFNTAFLTNARGDVLGTYDKIYLLAFGEYIPLGDTFPILYEWSPNTGHFEKGQHVRPLTLGEHRIGTLVCYEDILPGFVRKVVAEGNPHLLVNLTNDAWFGDTHEPWEHLALAKFRSVEHHRALVRATNSGVSALIDPVGRVIANTGVFTRENLHAELPMLAGSTAYEVLGDFPGALSLLAIIVWLWRARRSRRAA